MASVVYALAPSTASARPFVTGGLGLYNVDISVPSGTGTSSASETKIGFGGGAGVAIKAGTGGMRVVVATRFTSVSTDPTWTFLPITVGLSFGK